MRSNTKLKPPRSIVRTGAGEPWPHQATRCFLRRLLAAMAAASTRVVAQRLSCTLARTPQGRGDRSPRRESGHNPDHPVGPSPKPTRSVLARGCPHCGRQAGHLRRHIASPTGFA
jgi:hypothetical protein